MRLTFNVLIDRQPNNIYSAHCLELDLVSESDSAHDACRELLNIIDVQVRTCIQNDNLENLYFPAPQDVWTKAESAQNPSGNYSSSLQRVDLYI